MSRKAWVVGRFSRVYGVHRENQGLKRTLEDEQSKSNATLMSRFHDRVTQTINTTIIDLSGIGLEQN